MPVPSRTQLESRDTPKDSSTLDNLVAWIGKQFGNEPFPADRPYLHQYLHPDTDALKRQDLRPLNAPAMRSLDGKWRQSTFPDAFSTPVLHVDRKLDGYSAKDLSALSNPVDVDLLVGENNGLGHFKATAAKDATGPYVSVLDRWDMKSPDVPSLAGWFLDHAVGKPFNVYDRFDVVGDSDVPGEVTLKRRALQQALASR